MRSRSIAGVSPVSTVASSREFERPDLATGPSPDDSALLVRPDGYLAATTTDLEFDAIIRAVTGQEHVSATTTATYR